MSREELINHPKHYARLGIEPMTVIEDWCLDCHLGFAIKHIARAGYKGDLLTDLGKARWYIERRKTWNDSASYRCELSEAKWRHGRTDQDMAYILKAWALSASLEWAVVFILRASQAMNHAVFLSHLDNAIRFLDMAILDNS